MTVTLAAGLTPPAEFLADHTFRTVLVGTTVIGVVAGALGTFAYLRRQSLLSDVVSHSALPGTLIAFLVAVGLGLDGRNMALLILGAVVVGTLAVFCTETIVRTTKLAVDSAMAVTLTSFFGLGMLLMRVISDAPLPGKGGIQDYLFGNASVITRADLAVSLSVGAVALMVVVALWKEFALRTFDPAHAAVTGLPTRAIDTALFACIVVATVIGVKAVGLVLMVAFVVTPPATARQWTNRLSTTVILAGAVGGLGSAVGSYLSIALGDVPTGPLIVLVLFAFFLVSLLCAPHRGLIARGVGRARARRRLLAEVAA